MFLKIARFAAYAALMSPLIVNRYLFFPFITGKAIFFRVFVEIGLAALIIGILYGEYSLEYIKNRLKSPIFKAVLVFGAIFTITGLLGRHPTYAFWSNFERGEGVWQILHYIGFFIILSLCFSTKKDWLRLIGWQSIVASCVAFYAVGQAFSWNWVIDPPTGALSGTLGNPSYLGGYLLFSALLTLYLAFESGYKRPNTFWFAIFLFQIAMFYTAKTRGAFGALGAGIIIALIAIMHTRKTHTRHIIALSLGAVLAIAGIIFAILTVKGDAIKGFQPRLWTWGSALSGVIERPIIGWGAEHFPIIFDKYYDPRHYDIESWFDRAHSAPLEYATSGGLPLLAAYLFIFFALYRALMRSTADKRWHPLFLAMPAMYFVNGLVLFEILPLYIPFFFITAFIMRYAEGFDDSVPHMRAASRLSPPAAHFGAAFVTIVTLGTIVGTAYLPLRKNLLMLEALDTNNKTDDVLFAEYERALKYPSPVGAQEAAQNLFSFTIGYFEYLKKNGLLDRISKEKIDSIVQKNDTWYRNIAPDAIGTKPLYTYATALIAVAQTTGNNGTLERAHELVDEGEALAPTRIEFPRFRMALAVLEKDSTAYAQALKAGVALRPDLPWEKDMRSFKY